MQRFGRNAAAVCVWTVAGGLVCAADAAPHRTAAKPSADADITGVWMVQQPYFLGAALTPAPVLTPKAQDQRKRRQAAAGKGYVRSVSNMLCRGGGGPALSQIRSPFEVMQGFGRITFIFETETFNQPRTVYLNEKTQPDGLYPTENGHSIGHWDGRSLVVDTIGFNGRSALPGGVPASEQAHIVERFSVSPDGKVLTDQLVMTDPVNLAEPWTVVMKFDRMPDTEERFEVSCEPDLEALKTLDLDSLKDADPEIARLVDPDTRPTDPALKIAKPKS